MQRTGTVFYLTYIKPVCLVLLHFDNALIQVSVNGILWSIENNQNKLTLLIVKTLPGQPLGEPSPSAATDQHTHLPPDNTVRSHYSDQGQT